MKPRTYNHKKLKTHRKTLRSNPTEPEKRFWTMLYNKQFHGIKFRRQCSIGNYIADFYSFDLKLVIEIDGDTHYSEKEIQYDKKRTEYFNSLGITEVRFTNKDVMENLEGCYDRLEEIVMSLPHTPLSPP